jgi:hypothetical protein
VAVPLDGHFVVSTEFNGHGIFYYSLFTGGSVPDGGSTVMLLGAALGTLGMVRRYLKG